MDPDLHAWSIAFSLVYLAPVITLWLGYGLRKTLCLCFAGHFLLFKLIGLSVLASLWFAAMFVPIMALCYALARAGRGWNRLCDRIFGGSDPAKPAVGANRKVF